MIEFPKEFLWGAATSAYQVEGNNMFSDWWEWEKRISLKHLSGLACRHYEFYAQDFDLAKGLNHNCHRLSIEWARVEPEEGKFSGEELEHYRRVILALKERGLRPIVTLHHFTNPIWFAKIGAWRNRKADKYFLRYVEKVVNILAGEVPFWVTINEPNVYAYHSYLLGLWPPQGKSFFRARQVTHNLVNAHIQAYHLIRDIYKKNNLSYPKISIAQNMQAFIPRLPSLANKIAVYLKHKFYNLEFIEKLIAHQAIDFIGMNYYSPSWVGKGGRKADPGVLRKNSMGWDIYPQGLYDLLMGLKNYNLPVFILENGICTDNDALRWDYIKEHLESLSRAMQNGVKILGYVYWSLLDNFEWDKGFGPRFGLVEVDYHTYQRTIRESARKFSEVCLTNKL
ncbi:MAG: glycoside hydrolase family 1 protein [Candidatus Omnitrophica bacterium]|nr:glycoside hydrolase family 1 protein [Candidatus Omnitrophota bacterium]